MNDPESRTVFAGIDGQTNAELPEWYQRKRAVDESVTFAEAIRTLLQAIETAAAYRNPDTDDGVETERFNALVEPSRARAQDADGKVGTDPSSISPRTATRSSIQLTYTAHWRTSFARRRSTGRR